MSHQAGKQQYQLAEGNELRGFQVRIYPTANQLSWLDEQAKNLKVVWNWLVSSGKMHEEAVQSYAVRESLVRSRPRQPSYEGLEPDVSHATKQRHRADVTSWYREVREATKKDPVCAPRKLRDWLVQFNFKQDYQLLTKVLTWKCPEATIRPNAHMFQALVKNFFTKSARPKRFKKAFDSMPVQVRSGTCFSLGEFGSRGGNPTFYNCQIKIGGQRFRGRLPGKPPEGRVLEGVSLTREADGWYASIKVEVPKRKLAEPVQGSVVGIDVGLDNIAATSEGDLVVNTRGLHFNDKIAALQQLAADTGDTRSRTYERQAARLHQRARRHVRHVIYNQVIKPLARFETIKAESLESKIGQMGSRKLSVMRLTYQLLKERYGDRVREVDRAYTSQDCSQCGHRSKDTWSYGHGPWGYCPACGYEQHRDINAARNIAARPDK